MTERNSLQMARHLRGLLKTQRPGELKEQLRIWAAEFNRKARAGRSRRTKLPRKASV